MSQAGYIFKQLMEPVLHMSNIISNYFNLSVNILFPAGPALPPRTALF